MKLGELTVDFMPDDEAILGFSNRWYAQGIETAETVALDGGPDIRILKPALFVATKLEAYRGRGNGDLFASRDAEDILLVIDGRDSLASEIEQAPDAVRSYIAEQFRALLADANFDDFIEGNIRGPAGRSDIVRSRFIVISQCDGGG
jgi:predicted nucleotidyltransferase